MTTKSKDIFRENAAAYWARGLPVIPLHPKQKYPVIEGWSLYANQLPDAEVQAAWMEDYADGNIGLPLGPQSGLMMLDVDTDDPKILRLVEELLPPSPWKRIGAKGFAIAFRYDGTKTFRIKTVDGKSLMELLSRGTQLVLPPSIHPDTKKPYTASADLLEVLDQIPELPPQMDVVFREALREIGVELSVGSVVKLTEWVAPGNRDNSMIRVAGALARSVMRGECSFMRAIDDLQGWHDTRVEKVAGDDVDVSKGVQRIAEFILRDVRERNQMLPIGWDEGLPDDTRASLGFDLVTIDDEEWEIEQIKSDLELRLAPHAPQAGARVDEVEQTLDRMARSRHLSDLKVESVLRWIANTSQCGLQFAQLKKELRTRKNGKVEGVTHNEVADAMIDHLQDSGEVRYFASRFWQWNGSHFEALEDDKIFADLATRFSHMPAARKRNDHVGIYKVMASKLFGRIEMGSGNGINFANGFLTNEGKLLDHSPDFGMTYTLPYRYITELGDECPMWLDFLNDRWGEDSDKEQKIMALQEAMCATLLGISAKLQRAFLMFGVAGSGKSQVLTVVRGLMPDNMVSVVPPTRWTDKFEKTMMAHKLLNVAGELPERRPLAGDIFKEVIEGAEANGQYKGKDIFKFRTTCAQWFGSNYLPRSNDTSKGFTRRWLILSFTKPVSGKPVLDMGYKILEQEREAIAAWALKSMPRLLENQDYTIPTSHYHCVERMAQANDSVRFFIAGSGRIIVDRSGSTQELITLGTLYGEFWRYSLEAGDAKPVTLPEFKERMDALESELGFQCQYTQDGNAPRLEGYLSLTIVPRVKAAA